jgi:hypothetical protein
MIPFGGGTTAKLLLLRSRAFFMGFLKRTKPD